MKKIIISFVILVLAATAALSAPIQSIERTNAVSNAAPEGPQWVRYDRARHGVWQWQRGNNKNGHKGHFIPIPVNYCGGILEWPNGAMEMEKCGNELPAPPPPPKIVYRDRIREVVKEVPVIQTEIKWRTKTVTRDVVREVPGPMVLIAATNAQPLWAVTNAPQSGSQTVVPGAAPMGGFNYSPTKIQVCATGGVGGSSWNDNSNTNVPVNNNVIQVGDGIASGAASGSGISSAGGSPPPPTP